LLVDDRCLKEICKCSPSDIFKPNLFDVVLHGNSLFTNGAEIYGMLPMRLEERPTASTPTNSWQGGRWMRGDCICYARERVFLTAPQAWDIQVGGFDE
jgi:hypothetical protein